MKTWKVVICITAVWSVLLLSGCQEGARTASAARRWDRVMEQARIAAAQASIEQGRLAYARRVLQDVDPDSPFAEQARQMLELVKSLDQKLAAAGTVETTTAGKTVLN